jgi:hypothetical protein
MAQRVQACGRCADQEAFVIAVNEIEDLSIAQCFDFQDPQSGWAVAPNCEALPVSEAPYTSEEQSQHDSHRAGKAQK